MWLKWLPWRFIIRRLALSHGFVDPISVLSKLRLFAQPSEVTEPLELLRAGLIFHARGLLNTRAIQHNLDWIWPYWVEKQFDPNDDSFIPRAFSVTHVNLTHRNWTAVGLPGYTAMPIVDPRGLITPHWDGWSIDAWARSDNGEMLIPSRSPKAEQDLEFDPELAVRTAVSSDGLTLLSRVHVTAVQGSPLCRIEYSASGAAELVLSVRPCNPEGVAFIHRIAVEENTWRIDENQIIRFLTPPDRIVFGSYKNGDASSRLSCSDSEHHITCDVGMATAAAVFRMKPDTKIEIEIPLRKEEEIFPGRRFATSWNDAVSETARLEIPDPHFKFLYDAAVRTLILLTPGDVFPGPYTYKRFWFRDAAFILHALMTIGCGERAREIIDLYPKRQTSRGYFLSQEGEWDSNGAALWTMQRYCELTGSDTPEKWLSSIVSGAYWIVRKRLPESPASPHAGLLPPGFSAEHLGPNDYYYWDDFWSVTGLRAAALLSKIESFSEEADDLMAATERSMPTHLAPMIPASPYRRMDAGAIGSLAAGYPLALWPPNDPRLKATVHFLMEHSFVKGGFFQDMIHSGINAYLTLHIAQVLLRAGDPRFFPLVQTVASLASSTGQWPEAIHARTLGGCMGDGQHAWAAAEWILMMRNMFVREEENMLVIGSGIPDAWLAAKEPLLFGPTLTTFGAITVRILPKEEGVSVRWEFLPHRPELSTLQARIAIPHHVPVVATLASGGIETRRND